MNKSIFLLLIALMFSVSFGYVGSQYASTNSESPVLSTYEGYLSYYDNDDFATIIIENSTKELKSSYVYYVVDMMKGCPEAMDYAGKRLTKIPVVSKKVIETFHEYTNRNCLIN